MAGSAVADGGEFHGASFSDLDNVIHSVARKVAREYRLSWDRAGDDLVQAGWVGAMRAKARYKPLGCKFISYAYHFVNGDIRRAAKWIANGTSKDNRIDGFDDDDTHKAILSVATDPDALRGDDVGDGRDDPLLDDLAVRELLAGMDGLELVANELGYRDDSKRGAQIRREQLARLRKQRDLADSA